MSLFGRKIIEVWMVQETINSLAEILQSNLDRQHETACLCRLSRDVLNNDQLYQELIQALNSFPEVHRLASDQRNDGSWGRLHSQNSKTKQHFPTTEFAVERCLTLGLPNNHPILQQAGCFLQAVLKGDQAISDPTEKNERWSTGVELFCAGTLATFQPDNPVLMDTRTRWQDIILTSFSSGTYDASKEADMHLKIHGIHMQGSYLTLRNKYVLQLFSVCPDLLPATTQIAWVKWLIFYRQGLGYLSVPLSHIPNENPAQMDRWLASWQLLISYPPARALFLNILPDLMLLQSMPFGWDFGSPQGKSARLPIHSNWRHPIARRLDWTLRVLTLLSNTGFE